MPKLLNSIIVTLGLILCSTVVAFNVLRRTYYVVSVSCTRYVSVGDVRIFYSNSPEVALRRRCGSAEVGSTNSGCAAMMPYLSGM